MGGLMEVYSIEIRKLIVLALMVLILSFGLDVIQAVAADKVDCEAAYSLCVGIYGTDIKSGGVIYCTVGYLFCIKYLR
jgi:hypothetical protein